MKKIFSVLIVLWLVVPVYSQGVLKITAGTSLKSSNGAYIVLNNINFSNDGLVQQGISDGTIKFTGNSNLGLSGNGITTLGRLELALVSGSTLSLQSNINIVSEMLFTSGLLDLGNNVMDLGSTGFFTGESEISRAYATGTGFIQTTQLLNNPLAVNAGNLGAIISSSANLGSTIIRRGHQAPSNVNGSQNGIQRYYDIMPVNDIALNATLRFKYFDAELNGINETSLGLWKSSNNVNWTPLGYDNRDNVNNYVEKTGISDLSRWTLSTANPVLPASVSIVSNAPSNTICAGTIVIFTATPTNGGSAPTYQWYDGSVPVGTNSSTFTSSTLNNGDIVTVQMTSNATGATGSPATSNPVTMNVNPSLPASVIIASNAGTTICSGTSVTFTATPTNGGNSPTYQWYDGATLVGTSSPTYTTNTLSNGDIVTVHMTSNATCASGSPATSNFLTMTVNPLLPASVVIASNSGTTICAGTSVTFTATPTNGGSTPTYQWYDGTIAVGSNSPAYTTNTLNNGDVISVRMTSNATCASGSPAASNAVTMTVNPLLPASVVIASNVGTTICAGTSVTFTATPTNGGSAPSYQWYDGTTLVGTNSPTFTANTLKNGDIVTVKMTSNATCAPGSPVASNAVTMTVNPLLPASVVIASNSGTTICAGTSVTFTATPTNGGSTPTYQWYDGTIAVGSNSPTYTTNTLKNGDIVTVKMTSNATCATGSPAASNAVTMTVNPLLQASVVIASNAGTTICAGTSVTFTATPTNGGSTPSYQWYDGTIAVGSKSATFTTSSLHNGDIVTVKMTSNAPCATGSPVASNAVTMTVNQLLPASVVIASNAGTTVCAGTSVTFTATPTNGGSSPSYQWYDGTTLVGSNSATFTTSSLHNGDIVTVKMTSNAPCATGSPTTSNAVTMTVNQLLPASVVIASNAGTTVCAGTRVTFTATPTNGGNSPTYQWYEGAIAVGSNSPTYTTNTLKNGDIVTVKMTSIATCASGSPATSNPVTMTVNPYLPASVTIASNAGTTICAGASVTFTATPTNGGTSPSYQWYDGTTLVGTNSPTFTTNSLKNGDIVKVQMTSNAACATGSPATSIYNVTISPTLVTTAPTDPNLGSCTSLSAIQAAYATWKAGFTVSGGYLPTSNISSIPALPANVACNGAALKFTLTANNAAGGCVATSSSSSTFTVAPAPAPVFTVCPNNITAIGCNNVTYTVTATDKCSTPTYSYAFTGAMTAQGSGTGSGTLFPVGATKVIITATDACGNSSTCSFSVTTYTGNLTNYFMTFTNGSIDANWQGASNGFIGNVVVNGLKASERTSGTIPYAGTITTSAATLGPWQSIVSSNSTQASSLLSQGNTITSLTTELENAFTRINALPVSPAFKGTSFNGINVSSLNGLNTQDNIPEIFVINVTSGFTVASQIKITGDANDLFILRWDNDANFSNGYNGLVTFKMGGAIVPLGGLTTVNFINVAGDITSSGGGSNPAAPYPQGPRTNNGTGSLIKGGTNFNGGGFFTGYWLTTGTPTIFTAGQQPYGPTSPQSNGNFVGGWYSKTTQFSMTSGTSGVYVSGCSSNCNPLTIPTEQPVVEKGELITSLSKLKVRASPNPSSYYYNIGLNSTSDENVIVRVMDAVGRVIEQRTIAANSNFQLGSNYHPGTYFVQFVQGKDRVVIQLVKEGK